MARFRLTSPRVKLVENDIERACIDLLRLRGYYVVRLQSGLFIPADHAVLEALRRAGVRYRCVTVGEPGLPDYTVIKRDFFLEVKRPGAKLSPAQVEKVFELEKAYRVAVATVDGVEHLARWLDAHEKKAGTAPGL